MKILSNLAILLGPFSLLIFAKAKNIYLSPNGNDKISCALTSESEPFYSIDSALKCCSNNDTLILKGGEYVYTSVVKVTQSVTIVADDEELMPIIKLVNLRNPFLAVAGSGVQLVIKNLKIIGFSTIGEYIPSAGFILNYPGASLGNVEINGVYFQDFTVYKTQDRETHVISGVYQSLSIIGCSFTSSSSFNIPSTHIKAAVTKTLTISNSYFSQSVYGAYVLDPNEISASGNAIISNNTFANASVPVTSILVTSSTMTWTVSNSVFTGTGLIGPTCSFPFSQKNTTVLYLDQVTFDGCNNVVLSAENGCGAFMTNSAVINSSANSLLRCTNSALTVENTVFKGDTTQYLASCYNCKFSGSSNIWDSSESAQTPTCPL